jgi:5-methylcytosine-specific restriction endonuclease McrA
MPGGHIVLERDLQVDHITPVRHGGTSTPDNLTVLCRKCNIKKGDRAATPAWRQL